MIQFLLQAPAADGGITPMLIMFGGMILVLYFIVWRPQQKRTKLQKAFMEGLKRGEKVITVGGLHGKILDVKDDLISLEIADGVKVTINKSAVFFDPSKKPA